KPVDREIGSARLQRNQPAGTEAAECRRRADYLLVFISHERGDLSRTDRGCCFGRASTSADYREARPITRPSRVAGRAGDALFEVCDCESGGIRNGPQTSQPAGLSFFYAANLKLNAWIGL